MLQLAVAVELVAEEVAEAHGTRPHTLGDLGEGRLVYLEEPELRAARVQEGGGDPRHEVGAGVVVRKPHTAAQDLGRHCRGRRLAVGRGDQRRPERQPRREPVDGPGVQLPEQLAGERRPAAGSGKARKAAHRARDGDLGGERKRDAHGTREAIPGAPVFDSASRAEKAKSDASWAEASWDSVSWAEASWDSASWAEASWSEASWATASWASSSSAAASWADLSLSSASWADNAEGETAVIDGGFIDPLELEAVLAGTLDP